MYECTCAECQAWDRRFEAEGKGGCNNELSEYFLLVTRYDETCEGAIPWT